MAQSGGGYFSQLWQDTNQTLARTTERFQSAIEQSQAAQAIQESTTRVCNVCQQRVFRGNAFACEDCKNPCCKSCVMFVQLFNSSGISNLADPGRRLTVCRNCRPAAQSRVRRENVEARMKRLTAYLEDTLEPYKYSVESKVDQSFRLGGNVLYGVKKVANLLPVAGEAVAAINAGYYVIRYGPLVLAGDDVAMALQMLVSLAAKLEIKPVLQSSPKDFFGGLYYMMGEHSGERGKAPELEHLEHVDAGGTVPMPDPQLLENLRHLVRILYAVTYSSPTPTDAQRILKQVLPGSELVLVEMSSVREIPSYFLVCSRAEKKAFLLLPGTSNVADIVTDVNAESENLLSGCAHKGMTQSARWLLGEVSPLLVQLYTRGYKIQVVGHSLGAGVGALFTAMLRPQISTIFCYGFGTPACVDERLTVSLLDCMISVVNRDDVVPRLSVHNVQQLAESVLCPGQVAKTQAWLAEDWAAVKDVERIIELRRRENPCALEAAESHDEKIRKLREAGVSKEAAERALNAESGDLTRALLRATDEEVEGRGGAASGSNGTAAAVAAPPAQSSAQGAPNSSDAWAKGTAKFFAEVQKLGDRAVQQVHTLATTSAGPAADQRESASRPRLQACADYPRFFVPGQIVHLYRQNGLGRAALAPNTHDALVRIIPCQNMLDNHTVKAYDEAIHQACITKSKAPRWESYDERLRCACCDSDFNWAYVLRSEPQRMLARHHCYSCGKVVCDGCSQNRQAHPHLGFKSLARTCDCCFFRPNNV